MSTRWRYYDSKRGNGFRARGRGRGRGRGTSLTAIALPREDNSNIGEHNEAYFRDKPMNSKEFRDETVLSLSFQQSMLGATYYEQSSQLVKIMNDISEDHEFSYLKQLIEHVKPTMIIVNRSQDLDFIKLLSSKYTQHKQLESDEKDVSQETSEDTIPTWDASRAYSIDETSLQNEKEDEDDESFDGPPAMLYKLTNNFFKMPRAIQRLKMMVGAENTTMTEEDKYTIVTMRFDIEAVNMIRSFGALLLFLDETRLGVEKEPLSVTPPIKSIKTLTLKNLVDIDFNTIQALDILPKDLECRKSSGKNKSLFALVDRCRSTVGKKCLRKWFRNPTTDREVLVSRQKCVHYFKQDWNAEVTAKIGSTLGKVKALNNVFLRFQNGTAKLLHWECFVSTVNALLEIINIIRQTPISCEFSLESSILKEVSEAAIIAGSIINFAESKIQGRVTVMPGIDDELDKLRDIYENMPMVLTAIAKNESDRLGLPPHSNVKCVYIPLVGFVLSLPRDFPVENRQDMSLVYAISEEVRVRNATTERLDDEYGDILMKLIDSQTAIILTLKTRVMRKKRSISKLLSVAARMDALVALGLVAAENGWNCPTLVDEPVIEAVDLYHPISVLVVKKSFVPNQVSSGLNGIKASIITGPNACGKSIYMKSIGILAFLTHIGSFVPARHAKVGVVDRIVTRMFTVDSVLDGMSTFAKDVEQVALALRKATGNSLVIIDEFGKGTMTEVGLSLLASCMTHWMRKGSERCPHVFLSSHFHSLPKHIPLETNIATFLTFTVLREPDGKIKYLFRLTPGMVDCSFAMAVAKEEGIPMSVIGRACRIYKALKSGTPLKEIRAEVTNDNDEQMVDDMDAVLLDENGFMDAIESFVMRDKKASVCESIRSPRHEQLKDLDEREEVMTSISNRKSDVDERFRSTSAISSRSIASMDQLSIFDALLPKKKKKVREHKETEVSIESSRSPDPFSMDGEEEEYGSQFEEEENENVRRCARGIRKHLVPKLQKFRSEEEEEGKESSSRSTSSQYNVGNQCFSTGDKQLQLERSGVKRPRSPSTSSEPRVRGKDPFVVMRSMQRESQVPETPTQPSRNNSSGNSLKPELPVLKKTIISRISNNCIQDSMFKTPMNVRSIHKPQKSACTTPNNNQRHSISKVSKDVSNQSFNFTNDSIFKFEDVVDPILTPRSSSRREMRSEDTMKKTQTPKSSGKTHSSYSPVGSNFSIFEGQHSFSGLFSQNTSKEMSFFFETQNKEKEAVLSSNDAYTHQFGLDAPMKSVSGKQRSFIEHPKNQSKHLISPSSVILGDLVQEDIEKTPCPRGDKATCEDFEFSMNDNDPVYGENPRQIDSPEFDFLKSQNDNDDYFLKSFSFADQSSKEVGSSDKSAHMPE